MHILSIASRAAILASTFAAGYSLAERAAPKEPKGIQIEKLGAMDLAGEIESLDGLRIRLDRLTIQPGGMSPLHSHNGRPGIAYMVRGSYVSHAEGKQDEVLRAGQVWTSGKGRDHWIENVGNEPAVALLFVLGK